MLIKDGNKPDKFAEGHAPTGGGDWKTRPYHYPSIKKVFPGTCECCVFGKGEHISNCPVFIKEIDEMSKFVILPAMAGNPVKLQKIKYIGKL